MFNRRSLIAVALAGSALAGGYALAQQDQATVGIQTTTRYSLEGRIAAVDTNARTITITSAEGTQRLLNVSPMAANITSTKVGDNVAVGIEDTRTFVLSRPGVQTPAPGAGSVTGAVETRQGVAGASDLRVDRQLGGRARRSCRQHHHAGQSRRRRSAHIRRDHRRRPSAAAAREAG